MYQRGKIQEESLYYETLKDNGTLPIIGVNTFIADNIEGQLNQKINMSRCSNEEKQNQIDDLRDFQERNKKHKDQALLRLKQVALNDGNLFQELLYTVNFCSLGEITNLLFDVGGRYRRNM